MPAGAAPARPPGGRWGSLTPAELDVATLAAGGLSNPQIGARYSSRSHGEDASL